MLQKHDTAVPEGYDVVARTKGEARVSLMMQSVVDSAEGGDRRGGPKKESAHSCCSAGKVLAAGNPRNNYDFRALFALHCRQKYFFECLRYALRYQQYHQPLSTPRS